MALRRGLFFLYEPEKEFEKEVDNFDFEGTKVLVLNTNDIFIVKYNIEVIDLESNYLRIRTVC